MRRALLLPAVAACLGMMGCAKPTQKDWAALSGDRAGGSIKMAYQYNPQTEIPQVNDAQALELAGKRCQAWGYSEADAFGATFTQCTQTGPGFGGAPACVAAIVTREYQCVGTTTKPPLTGNAQKKTN